VRVSPLSGRRSILEYVLNPITRVIREGLRDPRAAT
jgi:hypothetical protein